MKLYRALEFSKLQFLLDENQYIFWINNDLNFNHVNSMNWWLDKENAETKIDRKKVISTITKNPNERFFNKSAEFNSIFGGRFNPVKSFGGIYCANSPYISSLEVLFHYIENSLNTLAPISKNKSVVQTILNSRLRNKIEVIVVAYEMECPDEANFYSLNDSDDSLKNLCGSIGFDRYLTDKFDRNFIFGNDYEISRIIGCHLHTMEGYAGFKVPSARVEFDAQDSLKARNYFVPEKDIDSLNLSLTGKFKEFWYTFSLDVNDDGHYDIILEVEGENGAIITREFKLEPVPNKKDSSKDQIISYEHNVSVEVKKNLREVHTQKFFKSR